MIILSSTTCASLPHTTVATESALGTIAATSLRTPRNLIAPVSAGPDSRKTPGMEQTRLEVEVGQRRSTLLSIERAYTHLLATEDLDKKKAAITKEDMRCGAVRCSACGVVRCVALWCGAIRRRGPRGRVAPDVLQPAGRRLTPPVVSPKPARPPRIQTESIPGAERLSRLLSAGAAHWGASRNYYGRRRGAGLHIAVPQKLWPVVPHHGVGSPTAVRPRRLGRFAGSSSS